MNINAYVGNSRTLRGENRGNLRPPSHRRLRPSNETSSSNPVQLIAGTKPLFLLIGGAKVSERVQIFLESYPGTSRDLSRFLLRMSATVLFQHTEQLSGLYSVTVRNLDAVEEVKWYVRFVQVRLSNLAFDSDTSAYDLTLYRGKPSIDYDARGLITGDVALVADAAIRLSEVHVNFIQNLNNQPRFFAHYDWVPADGDAQMRKTMGEWLSPIAGPWLDTTQDDEADLATAADGDESSFPFTDTGPDPALNSTLRLSDSPGGRFPFFIDVNREIISATTPSDGNYFRIRQIGGGNRFVTFVAARTKDAPFTFMILASVRWTVASNLKFIVADPFAGFVDTYLGNENLRESGDVRTALERIIYFMIPETPTEANAEVYGPTPLPDAATERTLTTRAYPWFDGWL